MTEAEMGRCRAAAAVGAAMAQQYPNLTANEVRGAACGSYHESSTRGAFVGGYYVRHQHDADRPSAIERGR